MGLGSRRDGALRHYNQAASLRLNGAGVEGACFSRSPRRGGNIGRWLLTYNLQVREGGGGARLLNRLCVCARRACVCVCACVCVL
jgi:hypothetical protein